MTFRGCWSCGAHGPCDEVCACAKCRDPEGYERWRRQHPDRYEDWLERQVIDLYDQCECPSCTGLLLRGWG